MGVVSKRTTRWRVTHAPVVEVLELAPSIGTELRCCACREVWGMTKVGNADNPEIDRRAAIKKGVVGATAAGLIWSGPKIERLTLRPLYAAAQTGPPQLIVVMSGANEVPPNMSAATGTATLTLDAFAGTVQVVYSNITGFTPTAAHIHGPAVAGSNAGVFIDFMGFGDTTVTPGTAAVNQLLAFTSLYYVNVHSAAFPGGEIRGQLI